MTHRRSVVPLLLLMLAGCQSPGHPRSYDIPAAKPPPAFPAPVATPIDPALQAKARAELHSALDSPDEVIRSHALETIKDVKLPDAGPIVCRMLTDPSSLVRKSAALTAGVLRIKSAKPQLEVNVKTAPLAEEMADVFALYRLGDTSDAHLFEHTATNVDKYVQGDTAMILGMLGNKTATPILVQMMGPNHKEIVRLQAAEALWKLGDQRGLTELVGATISLYPDDRMIAATALAEPRDTRVLGNVEGMLTDDYPQVALVAARAAGRLGSDDGYGVALQGAKSVDPRQRFLAALAFGAIGRTDAQPMLAKLLNDANSEVRLAAAEALLQLKRDKNR